MGGLGGSICLVYLERPIISRQKKKSLIQLRVFNFRVWIGNILSSPYCHCSSLLDYKYQLCSSVCFSFDELHILIPK
jgi:hypothetical protein